MVRMWQLYLGKRRAKIWMLLALEAWLCNNYCGLIVHAHGRIR